MAPVAATSMAALAACTSCSAAAVPVSARIPSAHAPAKPVRASFLAGAPLRLSAGSTSHLTLSRSQALVTRAAVATDVSIKTYALPDWASFEMGQGEYPVYWETTCGSAHGVPPKSGYQMTIYYHPEGTTLKPTDIGGILFSGGFNGPFMCGTEPKPMTRRQRGSACSDFYSIRINVPKYARTIEFSFSDGSNWEGRYKIEFLLPESFRGKPDSFFNEGLSLELAAADACENAIFPDIVPEAFRCSLPGGIVHEGGDRCELDIVVGCMDPEASNYDPFATRDDGKCDI